LVIHERIEAKVSDFIAHLRSGQRIVASNRALPSIVKFGGSRWLEWPGRKKVYNSANFFRLLVARRR
jgi:hypothetical protein